MKLELEKKSSRDFIYKQSLAIAAYELPYHPYSVIFFYEKNIDVSRKIFTIRPIFVSFSIFIEQSFPFLSPFFFFSKIYTQNFDFSFEKSISFRIERPLERKLESVFVNSVQSSRSLIHYEIICL